jgi:copper(I)-binding protein
MPKTTRSTRRAYILGAIVLAGAASIRKTYAESPRREHTIEAIKSAVHLNQEDHSRAMVLLTVVNRAGEPDRLDSALSPVAQHVHVQISGAEAGSFPEIPPGGSQEIQLELTGIKPDLRVGLEFPVVLIFQKAAVLRVDVMALENSSVPPELRQAHAG